MWKKSFWELKNRFKEKPLDFSLRVIVSLAFAFGIFFISYYSGNKFGKYSEGIRTLLPNLWKNGLLWILNYGLTLLFPFTILSSSISFLSIFFKDKSLNFYLQLPLKDFNYFMGRAFKTFVISNGYIYLIFLPFIWGLSNIKKSLLAIFPLTLYLLISFFIGTFLTLILSYFFKVSNLYKLFSTFFAIFVISLLIIFRISMPKNVFLDPTSFFFTIEKPEGFVNSLFFPLSLSFFEIIDLGLLKISKIYYFAFAIICIISIATFKRIYFIAYSKSFSSKEGLKATKKPQIIEKNYYLNIIFKEWLSILRTPLRLTQSILMLSLIFLYFFNFQMVPFREEPMMAKLYIALHFFLLSFILSALGLRFSFPSVSLEGKNFNIFKILPLNLKKVLFLKGLSYFLPFFLLSMVLNYGAFWGISFSLKDKIFSIFYGFFFSILASFFAVFSGFIKPNFKNPNPLQVGFSLEGLGYFFVCFLISIFVMLYYLRDFLKFFF